MSTLQLLLELRARQIATIQADYYHQRKNSTTLLDSTRTKGFNQRIHLHDNSIIFSQFPLTVQMPPTEWNTTNLMLNLLPNGSSNHLHNTRTSPITVNSTLAASYAPARAKRCNLNNISSSNCNSSCETKKIDKIYSKWLELYETLAEFRKSHGHCIVPRNYESTTLACWVRQTLYLFAVIPCSDLTSYCDSWLLYSKKGCSTAKTVSLVSRWYSEFD
jgi:hypothetical protein